MNTCELRTKHVIHVICVSARSAYKVSWYVCRRLCTLCRHVFFFTMCLYVFSHMSPRTCLVFTYLTLDLSSALFPGLVGIQICLRCEVFATITTYIILCVSVCISPEIINKHNNHMYPTRTLIIFFINSTITRLQKHNL